MKMTNYEADQHVGELSSLKELRVSLPALVGYRILQNLHALKNGLQPYYDAVDDAVRKYSGGKERINESDDPDAYAACVGEIAELRQAEIDVDVQTIEFEAMRGVDLPLSALFALDFMLKKE